MRVDCIELFHVRMPLLRPWRTAYGEDAAIESVLCHMTSGSFDAWGEASPLAAPSYSPEWAGGVLETCRRWFAPALLGREIASGEDLQSRLAHFKGNPFAKAVLDSAWWNLHSRLENRPLHELFGATRRRVPVGADFGVTDSLDALLEEVGAAVAQRFARIKLKFRPGWDLPMVRAVQEAFPGAVFHIDCNSGYTLADAALFRELDPLGLAMIEQPLAHDDLADHALLQKQLRTPICLDESIAHPRHLETALRLGSCRYVNVKPGRVGGLTVALRIHDRCRDAGIPCWVGNMLESSIGASQCAALAMLPNFIYPADLFPSDRFFTEELGSIPLVLEADEAARPAMAAPAGPLEPDPVRLRRMTVRAEKIC
jgi:O-succinylbenzoate synthase